LAGAGFTTINSVACSSRFTKVKISDYSIDPLNLALNGTVRKIYFSGDTLYLAGDFTSILGSTRNRFAKVNTLTTVSTLDDLDVNANDSIYDFNISGTNLYLGGKFTTVSATSRIGFASYDLTNLQLNAWNPGVLNGYINDIYVYGAQIVLGGDFTSMDVVTRYGLASYNTSTGVISA